MREEIKFLPVMEAYREIRNYYLMDTSPLSRSTKDELSEHAEEPRLFIRELLKVIQ